MKAITLLCIVLMVGVASAQQPTAVQSEAVTTARQIEQSCQSATPIADSEVGTLAGLRCVNLSVGLFLPKAAESLLPNYTVQSDVELKLRLAGIRIVKNGALPRLTIVVSSDCLVFSPAPGLTGTCAFMIEVSLSEQVRLARHEPLSPTGEHPATVWADTWKHSSPQRLQWTEANSLRDLIKDEVDAFTNEYLTFNPKVP